MSRHPWQSALAGPSAIAIHDNGDVRRKRRHIDFGKQIGMFRTFNRHRSEILPSLQPSVIHMNQVQTLCGSRRSGRTTIPRFQYGRNDAWMKLSLSNIKQGTHDGADHAMQKAASLDTENPLIVVSLPVN